MMSADGEPGHGFQKKYQITPAPTAESPTGERSRARKEGGGNNY